MLARCTHVMFQSLCGNISLLDASHSPACHPAQSWRLGKESAKCAECKPGTESGAYQVHTKAEANSNFTELGSFGSD